MDKLVAQIRNKINIPRKQYHLLKSMNFWNQLCVSMDVISDTEFSIQAFQKQSQMQDRGELYLLVFGLLQSLFVQQDAVDNLCESLHFKENHRSYPILLKIREIRNKTVGHPTKKGRSAFTYHYISGIEDNLSFFEFVTYDGDQFQVDGIRTQEIIVQQNQYLKTILEKVLAKLNNEEREHKLKYMKQKLSACFPDIGYCIEKIYNGAELIDSSGVFKARTQIDVLKKTLDKFKNLLADRGIDLQTYIGINFEYKYSNYPLQFLSEHFDAINSGQQSKLSGDDARVYTDSLQMHFERLKEMALKIDEEYEDLSDCSG